MRPSGRMAVAPIVILAAATLAMPVAALETDQYYAWDREIADSTEVVNAKVNVEIGRVLDDLRANRDGRAPSCKRVTRRVGGHFRQFIFHDIELWVVNTALVDRVPAGADEGLRYRDQGAFAFGGPFDIGSWVPPSPTIEIDGIRLGTDKLAHFFSEGWLYYRWLRSMRARGLDDAETERRIIRRGILLEKTVLGMTSSGIFSAADLEANFAGMRFFDDLCGGERPLLALDDDARWVVARPFDARDYVTPEWDESYNPSAFSARRWRRALPILEGYCSRLDLPRVVRERALYAGRERITPTERELAREVSTGDAPDTRPFLLDVVCGRLAAAAARWLAVDGSDENGTPDSDAALDRGRAGRVE